MDDLEDLDLHYEAIAGSKRLALQSVLDLNLPKMIDLSMAEFEILGSKINRKVNIVLDRLVEMHGDKLPHLLAIALRESWFALWGGAWYASLMIKNGGFPTGESFESETTPTGYADIHGYAGALSFSVGLPEELAEQAKFREGTPYQVQVSGKDVLECMAVLWAGQAVASQMAGNSIETFDWIYEALEASELANGIYMFSEGESAEHEIAAVRVAEHRKSLSKAGQKGALSKHKLTAELQDWARTSALGRLGDDIFLARKLFFELPPHLLTASKNPQRMIYDTLRKRNLKISN